jgi:hypothetical protein
MSVRYVVVHTCSHNMSRKCWLSSRMNNVEGEARAREAPHNLATVQRRLSVDDDDNAHIR